MIETRIETFRLATGEDVENRLRSKCGVPIELVRKVLLHVSGGPAQLKVTVNGSELFGPNPPSGLIDVVGLFPNDLVVFASREGKQRRSRFVHVDRPATSTLVTVILERRASDRYSIGAAHFGPAHPPEPEDARGIKREALRLEEETREPFIRTHEQVERAAKFFWQNHAFRIGADNVICTRCRTAPIPASEVQAAVHGKRILCHKCEEEVL